MFKVSRTESFRPMPYSKFLGARGPAFCDLPRCQAALLSTQQVFYLAWATCGELPAAGWVVEPWDGPETRRKEVENTIFSYGYVPCQPFLSFFLKMQVSYSLWCLGGAALQVSWRESLGKTPIVGSKHGVRANR